MMARISVAIEQQANQTQIFKVSADELWNDLTPWRIRLDVRDKIEPLCQCFRIFRSENKQRDERGGKDDPRSDDADDTRLRCRENNQTPGEQWTQQPADRVTVGQQHQCRG